MQCAENVMSKAARLSNDPEPDYQEVKLIDDILIKLLPEQDPFYARWRYLMERYLEPRS
jgi:hypothetical protein